MRIILIATLLLSLTGCESHSPYDHQQKQINPYSIDYRWQPMHPDKHIKWVGVLGGQISVDSKDQILEFIDLEGKRHDY